MAVGELEKHSALGDNFFALLDSAGQFRVVALLHAERHQPLREFAGLELRHTRKEDCRRCEEWRRSARRARAAGFGVDHRVHEHVFLQQPAGFLVTIRTGVVRVAGSSRDPI